MAMEQNGGSGRTGTVLNIIAGLWLILAPFALGFSAMAGAMWNSIIFGALVVILAIVGMTNVSETWSRWVNVVIGVWLFLSPFFLGLTGDQSVMWNNMVVGLLIIIFSSWSATMISRHQQQTHAM